MANWGLLGGLGRGLNQFGATVNQGVQGDIAAKRAEEIEAKRQASVERRWQASENRAKRQEQAQSERWAKQDERQAKQDKTQADRWAKQDKRQAERDSVSDSQFNRQQSRLEAQQIESNINGIMQSKQKAEQQIAKRYQAMSVDSLGNPVTGEQAAKINAQYQQELSQLRQQYSQVLETRVKSYGEKLRGTGYAYLLDIPEEEQAEPGASETTNTDPRDQLGNKLIAGEDPGVVSEKSILDKAVGGGTDKTADPTFAAGYARGLGGLYGNSARPIDESDLSPLETYNVSMGHFMGSIPGLLGDAGQIVNDYAVQPAWEWANTKPSQKK